MSVTKPYYRTVRQFLDGQYSEGGRSRFIRLSAYAPDAANYVRAYELIQKDLLTLFEYVDPADQNLDTYSFRTYELLLRTCTEIEANFKAIFRANKFTGSKQPTVEDYYLINRSHFLSDYEVKYPYWDGMAAIRRPFEAWGGAARAKLSWYDAYNKSKHDRGTALRSATVESLTDAVAALVVVLTAQFGDDDFGPNDDLLSVGGINDGMKPAVGDYFRVQYPDSVPVADRYDFTHEDISDDPEWLQRFDYDALSGQTD